MNLTLNGTVYCVGKKEDKMKDGTPFYSIAVATKEGDAGNLSCSKEVYDIVSAMNPYIIQCVYRDGQYKGLRVTRALDARHAEDSLAKELEGETAEPAEPAEPVKKASGRNK